MSTSVVEDEVLGLDVAVEDAVVVEVLEGGDDAGDEEAWVSEREWGWEVRTGLFFGEAFALGEVVAEVSAGEEVHDKVEVLLVLEGEAHVDEVGVFELGEELAFVHDGVDGALGDDAGLAHFLHGVELLGFLLFDLPDLAEAAAPDDVVEEEVVLGDG